MPITNNGKTAEFTQALVLSGFPGLDQGEFIIESFQKTGDEQELIEVNDLSDNTLYRDYVPGMITTGEVSITVYGRPNVTIGQTGKASVSSAAGKGQITMSERPVIIVKEPEVSSSKGELLKTTIVYRTLAPISRLAPTGATGATGVS